MQKVMCAFSVLSSDRFEKISVFDVSCGFVQQKSFNPVERLLGRALNGRLQPDTATVARD
jgi:hypothetical protein